MRRRRAAAGLAVAVAATATLGGGVVTPSADAQSVVYAKDLSGNFAGDARDEVFAYVSGSTPDALVTFSNGGVSGGPVSLDVELFTVNGSYDPVAGDFDGDGYDEILWYAAGTRQDYIWDFTSATTITSRPYTVNGTYDPVVGDFNGDGVDDVTWYARGTARDYIWEYNVGGGYTSAPRTINGYYTPIPGSFGSNATDDILFYAPGPGADYLWDYNPDGSYASRPYPANGYYWPFVLDIWNDGWQGEDIFFYAPGTAPDYVWDFFQGDKYSYNEPVNGFYYAPVAGDFLGDGHDDVLWFSDVGFNMWDYAPDPAGLVRWDYSFSNAAQAAGVTAMDPSVAPSATGAQADSTDVLTGSSRNATATPGPTRSR